MAARRSFGPDLVKFINDACIPLARYDGGNAFTIQTVGGKVLGAPQPGFASILSRGYEEFLQLPETERKPAEVPATNIRPKYAPPEGGLVILVQSRVLVADENNQLQPHAELAQKYSGPQRDFLWLTADEAKSLAPAEMKKDFEYKLPEPLMKRLACFYLIDRTVMGVLEVPWPAEHLRASDLKFKVLDVADGKCSLELSGYACLADHEDDKQAARQGAFHLYGRATYNVAMKRFEQFELAAFGAYVHAQVPEYLARVGQEKSVLLGMVFELAQPGSIGYGILPFVLSDRRVPNAVQHYFGRDPFAQK
jgi:hypothetical protein